MLKGSGGWERLNRGQTQPGIFRTDARQPLQLGTIYVVNVHDSLTRPYKVFLCIEPPVPDLPACVPQPQSAYRSVALFRGERTRLDRTQREIKSKRNNS